MSWRMAQKSRLETGSTPFVGSSRSSTSGVWTSAHMSASFCFMPPESLPALRFMKGPIPLNSRSLPALS